ncbi:hypothetical protein [Paenibacillus kribbensis]|uniref:hypothetical protein n=1 Tax=Paenibacillus kribbensis TaxID=172713 RepID=UPI0008396E36|nr:hypothetical protein [Paenibacillus kribbensis]
MSNSYKEREEDFVNKEMEFLNKLDISDNDKAAVRMSIREAYRKGFAHGEEHSSRLANLKILDFAENMLGELEKDGRTK